MPSAALTRQASVGLVQRKVSPPPLPDPLLRRPRLESLLRTLVEGYRVVVISATAGAGKTTTAVAAAGFLKCPLAWLSVDRTDAAPGRLVTYLEAALARRIPELSEVATGALAQGIQHPEATGLLVEAVGDAPLLLVVDDLERLGASADAWAVMEALVRYAPSNLRIVLVSRREVPAGALGLSSGRACAVLGDGKLAFTPEEAAEALRMLGEEDVDAGEIVEATGGWVTGVLFEAWRSAEHVAGVGGEADPLDGYLSSQILEQLDAEDREFLVTTSVLDEVTVARATALGKADAGERLVRLRAARMPVVWGQGGDTMRCHPRFREHLLQRLELRGPEELRAVRIAHGQLLAREGHYEEATEELLRVGAPVEAIETADHAILAVVERLDFPVAKRWVTEFDDLASGQPSRLKIAQMMLALASDDYRGGVRIADQLAELDDREELARSSDRAAALIACFYLGVNRLADAHAVLDAADEGPETSIVRYTLGLYEERSEAQDAGPSGAPMDGVLMFTDYFHGRLNQLAESPVSRWANAVAYPWQIAARCALGHTHEALEGYASAQTDGILPVCVSAYVGPEVLIDAGHREEARDAIAEGHRMALASGARDLLLINRLMEAKRTLRLENDASGALEVLDRIEREPEAHWPFIRGPLNTWRGYALLLESSDAAALGATRRAVETMVGADLMLELPTAATYLAEAEWRNGNEEAADRAADLALRASRRLGSNHRLLQALADFPAVSARRIDAERAPDSNWHEVGRALIAQGVTVPTHVGAAVELREFGEAALLVNGEETRPRITKSYELLAYLIARRGTPPDRDDLLDALFDGRADDSTRSYLRQAVYWVRRALPDDGLVVKGRQVRLSEDLIVTSESIRFESLVAEAARLEGQARRAAIVKALELFDKGDYLAGANSPWVDKQRQELMDRATEARYEAAELTFVDGRYADAQALADEVLQADPLREAAWQLVMRIASAVGDDDGALGAYDGCRQALAKVGAAPAPTTVRLLELTRR